VFVRRSTRYRDLALLQMQLMVASRAEGVVPSAKALEGLRRQLLMALPPTRKGRRLRRRLGANGASNAYNRMASVFMAAYGGQPGIGEFEVFRKAVIEAAGERRTRLDVLAEVHEWLIRDRGTDGVLSQLEARLDQQGIQIIGEPSTDYRSDSRFVCHGPGKFLEVASPAYTIDVDGTEVVVRQGHIECESQEGQDRENPEEGQEKVAAEVNGEHSLEVTIQEDEPANGQSEPCGSDGAHIENSDATTDDNMDLQQGGNAADRAVADDINDETYGGKEQ